jgi:Flp pilus assembly protein TadG
MKKPINKGKHERGDYMITFAILLPVIVGVLALMFDITGLFVTRHRVQVAADVAVYAASQGIDLQLFYEKQRVELDRDVAPANAGSFLSANGGGNISLVGFYVTEDQIWVTAQGNYTPLFGAVFGAGPQTITVTSSSVPEWGIDQIEQ